MLHFVNKCCLAVVLLLSSALGCVSQDIKITTWTEAEVNNFSFYSDQGSKLSYSVVGKTVFFNSSNSNSIVFSDVSLTIKLFDAGVSFSNLGNGVFTFSCMVVCDIDVRNLGGSVVTASVKPLNSYSRSLPLFSYDRVSTSFNDSREFRSDFFHDDENCDSCGFQNSCSSESRGVFYLSGMRYAVSETTGKAVSFGHDIFRWYDYDSHISASGRELRDVSCGGSYSVTQRAINLYLSGDIDEFSERLQLMSERDIYLLWLGWPSSSIETASSTFDIVRKLKGFEADFLSFSGQDDGVKRILNASLVSDISFLLDYTRYLSAFGYEYRGEDQFVHALLRYLQPAIKYEVVDEALRFLRSGWIPEQKMNEVSAHFLMMLSLYGGKNDFLEFVFTESPETYGTRVRAHVADRLDLYGFATQAAEWQPG